MRRMRYLLVPGNNSLSHIAKCLAAESALRRRGHKALVAVSRRNAPFLERLGIEHAVLPDIQESDGAGLPTAAWFKDTRRTAECVRAEVELIRRYKPDRAVGVFRFTLKASAAAAGVPFDSLICGCMLPGSGAVLGFRGDEPEWKLQQFMFENFFRFAGAKASGAFAECGLGRIDDIRSLLVGDRTFLWDFPEFFPLPPLPDTHHVGPITWNSWPYDKLDIGALARQGLPVAVIAFGTCASHAAAAERITRILLGLGYHVVIAAGGRDAFLGILPGERRVTACSFAPLHEIFPHASLLVTHGGQMTVFEALQQGVPVAVLPFQPEQAHNGVCLERTGCGKRLIPSQFFLGDQNVYLDAFDARSDDELARDIVSLVNDPALPGRLSAMRRVVRKYRGIENLVAGLEGA